MDSVSFELQYITDQLSFYGLKKQTGGNALRLAHLLFSYVHPPTDEVFSFVGKRTIFSIFNAQIHTWSSVGVYKSSMISTHSSTNGLSPSMLLDLIGRSRAKALGYCSS